MPSGPAQIGFDVVVPTLGRPSLARLLAALARQLGEMGDVLVVDDRPSRDARVPLGVPSFARVLRGGGRGPAAARNAGWRASGADWVAFLDDDVVPGPGWARELRGDLAGLASGVAASQGRLVVPLPDHARPTDWERNVAGLQEASWISADIALRRQALESVGGFDERFAGAYREDTDLAMRLMRDGWQIARGRRRCEHPVPSAGFWVSVARQRGNADDVLMRALHGRHWRRWGRAPRGRLPRHLLAAGSLAGGVLAVVHARRRFAAALLVTWLGLTGELALARIAPGPRDRAEVVRMLATSPAIPFAATWWWLWGVLRLPLLLARTGPRADGSLPPREPPWAVLLDRDGTLVVDVPYNGDPAEVAPLPGAPAGPRVAAVVRHAAGRRQQPERRRARPDRRRAGRRGQPTGGGAARTGRALAVLPART